MSEPVAWMWTEHDGFAGSPLTHFAESHPHWGRDATPLYTADAIREAVLAEREAISKFCADVYEKSASRDDGLDPFENGIKWTTEQISSWIEKRGAA